MKKLLLPIAIIATLSGCASVPYDCELRTEVQAKCASMQDAYTAASGPLAPMKNRQNVFEGQAAPRAQPQMTDEAARMAARPYFKGEESAYPEPGERGMPVFKQPEVHRVWVAPYVDSDGNLRSGEYTYFSTPGSWNYGSTRRPGEAAAIFGPAKPGNLGFAPAPTSQNRPAPAAPPGPSASTARAASESVNGITQPAQRIAP